MRIATITHRASPLLNTFVHGSQHGELPTLHRAIERLLLPMVRSVVPELVDFAMPVVGGWQRCAVLAIRKAVAQQGRRTASAFWGLPWTKRVKLTIVVDQDVSVGAWDVVLAAVTANVDFKRDLFMHDAAADVTDHARRDEEVSQAIAIDATSKLPGEQARVWPRRLELPPEIRQKVQQRWKELGLPEAERSKAR
jgi:4-hydroxy-3-polyprenylbenzoate decarboxylase